MKANFLLLLGLLGMFLLGRCPVARGQVVDPLDQWQMVASPRISIRGLAYQNGRFVAGGATTNIIVSTNGVSWPVLPSGVTNYLAGIMAVANGAGKFVAVGGAGLILTSPDGLQWTELRTDLRDDYWAVIYARGQFVVVGFYTDGGYAKAIAVTSADGTQWKRSVQPYSTTPRNVTYGNGLYVAAGSPISLSSTNGQDWTPLNGVLAQGIAYGGGQFIATLDRRGYRSSNGVDWTEISLPTLGADLVNYYTASYANGLFVTGGFCDDCPNTNRPALVATSPDGIQWTSRVFGTNNAGAIRDIIFVDGAYYLGDQDGRIWKSGRTAPSSLPVITQVTHAGGLTTLSFAASPGFRYLVECVDDLGSAAWRPCAGPVFAADSQLSVIDPNATADGRFYRIRVP